jgi:hypothetical protein
VGICRDEPLLGLCPKDGCGGGGCVAVVSQLKVRRGPETTPKAVAIDP